MSARQQARNTPTPTQPSRNTIWQETYNIGKRYGDILDLERKSRTFLLLDKGFKQNEGQFFTLHRGVQQYSVAHRLSFGFCGSLTE